ncbi:MAG: hypothetical protein GX958_09870, partial [Desulfitobacterium sp.]|nr:hypothetical protein [Desulfitobacterium sp.]
EKGEVESQSAIVTGGPIPESKSLESNIVTTNVTDQATYTVSITTNKDNNEWSNCAKTISLHQNGNEHQLRSDENGIYNTSVVDGTYSIYVDGVDTGLTVKVNGEDTNATVDFYTVIFDTNGGSPAPAEQIVLKDDTIEEPAEPTKESYTFYGWSPTITEPVNAPTTFTAQWNSAPTAIEVKIEGSRVIGQTINGQYTYTDEENDEKGTSEYQWYRSDSADGEDKEPIEGATEKTYKITRDDYGKYLFFEVTPIANTGVERGEPKVSDPLGPIRSSSGGGGGGSTPPPSDNVTGKVVDKNTGETVKGVEAKVTTESDGSKTIEMKTEEAIVFKKPDGTNTPIEDVSRIGLNPSKETPGGSSQVPDVSLKPDGTIEVKNINPGTETEMDVTIDLGNGQKIIIGKIQIGVSSDGDVDVTCSLIDPYGIITNTITGEEIEGVHVVLYYADTEKNIKSGKTPHTEVDLPILPGFEPNYNKNPQYTNEDGSYAYMVFPYTDYYVVAIKDGYFRYVSPILTVDEEIVKWDFRLNPQTIANPITGVHRLSGLGRVDTAIEIAKATYPGKVNSVIIATANNYPDALTGSVLAYKIQAPIILVGYTDPEEQKVLSYLKEYLEPNGSVYILGGNHVVSDRFESKVRQEGYKTVKRLAGADRYGTALEIADEVGVWDNSAIFLVSGESYPDALSASSIAAVNQFPILLVRNSGIDLEVNKKIAEIEPGKVFIIGQENAVSKKSESQLKEITPIEEYNVERIGGAGRYETSVEVAKYFDLDGNVISFATGNNFPDALAGSMFAAKNNGSIILVNKTLSQDAAAFITQKGFTGAAIFGGENAVSKEIAERITQIIGK